MFLLGKDYKLRCRLDEIACSDNSKCISRTSICDGKHQCQDGSDEVKCHEINIFVKNSKSMFEKLT